MNITPMHLGSLHPMEQALTLLLAFGPFVVLGIVIVVRRRHDRAADEELARQEQAPDPQRER
jgi:cytochrome c-type biogenesis protein CcmH/NrfF